LRGAYKQGAAMSNSPQTNPSIHLKSATEYPLPAGTQTHEIVSPVAG